LNEHGNFPSYRLTDLRDRLTIASKDPERQKRAEQPRQQKHLLAQSRRNRARRLYLEVLDKDPHAFLPFILGVSPRSCVTFDLKRFFEFQKNNPCRVTGLSAEAKASLEDIAKDYSFIESPHFKKLLDVVFREGGGVTQIEGSHTRQIEYKYWQTSITQIEILEDPIKAAFKASTQWKQEREIGLTTTDCMIALIPRNKSEDISIVFSVGHKKGLELMNELQPEEESEVELSLPELQTEADSQFQCTRIALDRVNTLGICYSTPSKLAVDGGQSEEMENRQRNVL